MPHHCCHALPPNAAQCRPSRAFLYSGFLSHDECDHLITLVSLSFPSLPLTPLPRLNPPSLARLKTLLLKVTRSSVPGKATAHPARDKVSRSSVADNESGKSVLSEIRTSSGTFLNKYQDDIVKRIEERIAAWTFLPKGTPPPQKVCLLYNSTPPPCSNCASSGAFLNKYQDDMVKRIEEHGKAHREHGEAIQILKYEIGQKYEAHFDYFFDSVNTQMGGHRVATVLMYLTTVEAGGETVFPNAQPRPAIGPRPPTDATASECANRGLAGACARREVLVWGAVKPQKGDALLFYSLHPDGTTDQSSLHASCPVIRGEKWSATKWIHVRSFEARPLAHGCEDLNPKSLLPAQVLRNLSDKLYDKRKAAALEIETAVKAAVAEGNDERINAIISLLANDYATSAQPNQRKGGLIGLAAVTVGLGPDARLAAVTVGLGPDASRYLDVRVGE
ncbi:unnamed protein product [Closterium sp. NIES-64]|nr:unnamed protein product [Closterium sp. NIES-64]